MNPNRKFAIRLISFCGVLFIVAPAFAQIDYRINTATDRDGRLLDKNPLVGSGGINGPVSYPIPGMSSNAIITGNVTGLGGFKGYSPIVDTSRFRAELPSSGLSGFQAETVNLNQVTSGAATYRPSFYYGQSETISDLGYIRNGLNIPGSSTLRSTLTTPPTPLNSRPIDSLLVQPTAGGDTRLQYNLQPFNPMMQQTKLTPITDNRIGAPAITSSGSPVMSSYGMATAPLTTSYSPTVANQPNTSGTMEALRANSSVNDVATMRNTPISNTVQKPTEMVNTTLTPSQTTTPLNGVNRDNPLVANNSTLAAGTKQTPLKTIQQEAKESARADSMTTGPMSTKGNDRFAEMVNAVGRAQAMGVKNLGFLGRSTPQVAVTTADGKPIPPSNGQATDAKLQEPKAVPTEHGIAELATVARWAHDTLEDPVRTFASKNKAQVDEYIEAGEKALKLGQYYNAARWFDMASTIAPTNPLPLLGRGHALMAAGDYMSAFLSIRRGLERFPQIAAFRLDLPSLVGRHDTFDLRRADLESKLEKGEHYELRFLLGYIQLYSDLTEEGLLNLEQAAKGAPPHSIVVIFPDLILGKRELPPLEEP